MSRSKAGQFRRRAQACLISARASVGEKRLELIDMAQTWLRLAEEVEAASPPTAVSEAQAVMQQQHQVQPKDNDKKG
jgi:hypothetical protein